MPAIDDMDRATASGYTSNAALRNWLTLCGTRRWLSKGNKVDGLVLDWPIAEKMGRRGPGKSAAVNSSDISDSSIILTKDLSGGSSILWG